jgi:hypothetical protein
MKTSSKLILTALPLILAAIFASDYQLKEKYLSGTYKDPYYSFAALKFKDFDTVDVFSSTAANVKFVQGPFSVRIDADALDYTSIKQKGSRLQISATFTNGYLYNRNPYLLVVSCPKLAEVNTDATYQTSHKPYTDTIVRADWNMRLVLIDGFKQDSLTVSQDYGSTVVFANDDIKSVKVITGKSQGSGSKTIVLKGNQFGDATFNIGNKSRLILNDAIIHNLNYHLADSAQIVFTGAAQNLLKNSKPKQ